MWLYIISISVLVFTALALIGIAVVLVVVGRRMRQIVERVYPQNPNLPVLPDAADLFRDDGQHIAVGTRRSKVLDALFRQVIFLLGMSLIIIVLMRLGIIPVTPTTPRDYAAVVAAAAMVAVFAITIVLEVVRLVRRGPALLITSDGIEDHASLIATGMGLIRWHEMYLVTSVIMPGKGRRAGRRQLAITLINRRAVLRRQPLWKRAVRALYTPGHMPTLDISTLFLSLSADDLAEQINAFAEAHAPPGWVWPGIRRFLEDEDEATEADRVPGARDS